VVYHFQWGGVKTPIGECKQSPVFLLCGLNAVAM